VASTTYWQDEKNAWARKMGNTGNAKRTGGTVYPIGRVLGGRVAFRGGKRRKRKEKAKKTQGREGKRERRRDVFTNLDTQNG